jgi:hypothetical protein
MPIRQQLMPLMLNNGSAMHRNGLPISMMNSGQWRKSGYRPSSERTTYYVILNGGVSMTSVRV